MAQQQPAITFSDSDLLELFDSDEDLSALPTADQEHMLRLVETRTKPPVTPVASHRPQAALTQAMAEADPNYLSPSDARTMAQNALQNAPMTGATAATMLGPMGLVASPAMALLGGTGGAVVRGDEHPLETGAVEALREMAGNAVPYAQAPARSLMKGQVPRAVLENFDDVDVPAEMLKRGAFPGVPASARRVEGLSKVANAATERAVRAADAPSMNPVAAVADFRELYQQAMRAGERERAARILEEAKASIAKMRQADPAAQGFTGPQGFTAPAQLDRKRILQGQSDAALLDPANADLIPQLRNAERRAIVRNLHQTPSISGPLKDEQALMAINQTMKKRSLDSFGRRLRGGSLTSAVLGSPVLQGGLAHGLNQGARLLDPKVNRLLQALMQQRSTPDEY